MRPRSSKRRCESGRGGTRLPNNDLMAESANGCECESVSMPGACSCGALLAFCGDCMAGSPLIIKDLDLYPQPLTTNWSPALNSEEPNNGFDLG